MSIDPNVQKWNVNYANDPLPPDFKSLVDLQTAITQEIAHTAITHPNYAALQTRASVVAQAIANHPKRSS